MALSVKPASGCPEHRIGVQMWVQCNVVSSPIHNPLGDRKTSTHGSCFHPNLTPN
ncbi:hypothetical protein [Laspinema palackyanum]|uniref:hypothetical protein n=1 Tax=Laspinema palackyanum TaxID=3231601 RepID=UPI00345CFC41|nr:hypothetical protein [Laspinema sp. D2c]